MQIVRTVISLLFFSVLFQLWSCSATPDEKTASHQNKGSSSFEGVARISDEALNCEDIGDRLEKGQILESKQCIVSASRKFHFVMQPDGNAVVYSQRGVPIFATTTNETGAYLILQKDGNMVVYKSDGTEPLWTSNTQASAVHLVMQDDGNLVLYDSDKAVWSSETGGVSSVDILDYMIGWKIKNNHMNEAYGEFFPNSSKSSSNATFSIVKFGNERNYEIFHADAAYIYLRYEVTPETYGGRKNVLRRFQTVSSNSTNAPSGVQVIGNTPSNTRGHIWSKRYYILKDDPMNTVIKAGHSIDAYDTNAGGEFIERLSTGAKDMYVWVEKKRISAELDYLKEEFTIKNGPELDHKIVINQQWSRCNIEQYEYGYGVGYIGWRSLVSLHPECESSANRAPNKNQYREIPNQYIDQKKEKWVVVQGLPINGSQDLKVHLKRVKPILNIDGKFIDDYPYHHTSMGDGIFRGGLGSFPPTSETGSSESKDIDPIDSDSINSEEGGLSGIDRHCDKIVTLTLTSGRGLHARECLISPNKSYLFTMQGDGNGVLYRASDHQPLFATTTFGSKLHFQHQSDGNLVVYTPNGQVKWTSNTGNSGNSNNSELKMQNDGNLVLFRNGAPIWASETNEN